MTPLWHHGFTFKGSVKTQNIDSGSIFWIVENVMLSELD